MDAKKIGKFIHQIRTKKRMTQKELAEQINGTDKAVSKWENGEGCPDVSLLPVLSKVLNVEILDLLEGNLPLENTSKKICFYDFETRDVLSKNQMFIIWNFGDLLCNSLSADFSSIINENVNNLFNTIIIDTREINNEDLRYLYIEEEYKKLKGKGKDYNQLTDLAIDHKDITIEKGNIQVCLHNVSGKDAPRALVILTDSSGKVLSQSSSSILAAPNDLNARTTRVQLSFPEGVSLKGCRIVIDPNNEIDEIYESNNQVAL